MLLTIKHIIKKIFLKSKSIVKQLVGYPIIYNANNVQEEDYNKRALIVFLIKPFKIANNDDRFLKHQNFKQCKQIAAVVGEFGYVVDVADVKSKKLKSSKKYDIIISHNFKLDEKNLDLINGAIRIYISSGMNHVINNKNLRNRYKLLKNRRECNLKVRNINDENMSFVDKANYIIGFGNDFIAATWKINFKIPTYSFNNYGINTTKYVKKNFILTKKSFLFFASGSQVGKGLDLLLEIFPKHPDLHLYICSSFKDEPDFCRCYNNELYKTPNIHPIGWVKVNSDKFIELSRKCSYVILPTCSEGQAGSVVQCMYAALIPVVTKESGIDTEDFGVTFKDDSLDEIENTIIKLSDLPSEWHKEHSLKTRKISEEKYSEEAFMNRWREIMLLIV